MLGLQRLAATQLTMDGRRLAAKAAGGSADQAVEATQKAFQADAGLAKFDNLALAEALSKLLGPEGSRSVHVAGFAAKDARYRQLALDHVDANTLFGASREAKGAAQAAVTQSQAIADKAAADARAQVGPRADAMIEAVQQAWTAKDAALVSAPGWSRADRVTRTVKPLPGEPNYGTGTDTSIFIGQAPLSYRTARGSAMATTGLLETAADRGSRAVFAPIAYLSELADGKTLTEASKAAAEVRENGGGF